MIAKLGLREKTQEKNGFGGKKVRGKVSYNQNNSFGYRALIWSFEIDSGYRRLVNMLIKI